MESLKTIFDFMLLTITSWQMSQLNVICFNLMMSGHYFAVTLRLPLSPKVHHMFDGKSWSISMGNIMFFWTLNPFIWLVIRKLCIFSKLINRYHCFSSTVHCWFCCNSPTTNINHQRPPLRLHLHLQESLGVGVNKERYQRWLVKLWMIQKFLRR